MSMDYKIRIYAGADWRDITGDVQPDRGGVTITQGRSSETSGYQPSTARLTLDNRAGDYSTVNPTGAYYGSLSNNTPIEIYRQMISALFTSTVASAWPDATFLPDASALSWTTFGSGGVIAASDYSSSGGRGNHSVPAVGYRSTYLAAVDYRHFDLTVDLKLDTTNITGGPASWNVLGRGTSTSVYWRLNVAVQTDESIVLRMFDPDGIDPISGTPTVVAGITHTTAQVLRLRVQFEDDTIRSKLWVSGAAEPYDWSLTSKNIFSDLTTVESPHGWIGLQSRKETGNSNGTLVFSYDNLDIRFNRFAGEVSSWPVEWDVTGRDIYSVIEAAGVMRRIGTGNANVQSSVRSYVVGLTVEDPFTVMLNIQPFLYLPMEERPQAPYASAAVGTNFGVLTTTVKAASQQWGNGDLAPWLTKVLAMYGDSELNFGIHQQNFVATDGWSISFVCKHLGDQTVGWYLNTDTFQWQVFFIPASKEITVTHPAGSSTVSVASTFFDSAAHTIELNASQSGGNIVWECLIDNQATGLFALDAGTLTRLVASYINAAAAFTSPFSIGHITVMNAFGLSISDAAKGFPGETANHRLYRMAADAGIPLFTTGRFNVNSLVDDSVPMHTQALSTVGSQFDDCERTDMGILYDARGTLGMAYRPLAHLLNQDAALTLTYSSKHISPPFVPTTDDRLTANDVTATSSAMGDARSTLDSGPKSTAAPSAGGIGRYPDTVSVNPHMNAQLQDIAGWHVHLGTADRPRVPDVSVTLDRTAISTALLVQLLQTGVGDRIQLNSIPQLAGGSLSQLVVGYEEKIDAFVREIRFHCVPEDPYEVAETDDATARVSAGSSYLNANVTSSATSFAVKSLDGTLWSTAAGDVPVSILVGGEQMTVGAITGSSSPQTFSSVTRSVNGVVKAHTATDTETSRVDALRPAVVSIGDY